MKSEFEKDKALVFGQIISAELGTYTSMYAPAKGVMSTGNIARNLYPMSRYRVKKAVKALMADGLIYYTSIGCPAIESAGEYRELVCEARPPVNGYALTEGGLASDAWEEAYEEWKNSMRIWAEGGE